MRCERLRTDWHQTFTEEQERTWGCERAVRAIREDLIGFRRKEKELSKVSVKRHTQMSE